MDNDVVIVGGSRTAIGSLNGSLSGLSASHLGGLVIDESMKRASVNPGEVTDVIMGQIVTAGCGQNPARQAAVSAKIPFEKTATSINQVCGSGLKAVAMGYQSILTSDSNIVVAGGQESMSQAPHCIHLRSGKKMGDAEMVDTMIYDALWDVFNDYHMGVTAENIATKWQITRQEQDDFAASSQFKASNAQKDGRFDDEIVRVVISEKNGSKVFDKDEYIRANTTVEKLSKLSPAFDKEGTVTAGNSAGINDGAASVILMRKNDAVKRGIKTLFRIVAWAQVGVDPKIMGTGPIPSVKLALKKAGWKIDEVDLVECNEAFAVQTLSVIKELGLPMDKVNSNGGAIALGHPVGASGARTLVTLMHEMQRRKLHKGIVTLCMGGGMGIALCVEQDN